jgi:hypothetical protein
MISSTLQLHTDNIISQEMYNFVDFPGFTIFNIHAIARVWCMFVNIHCVHENVLSADVD